MAAKIYKKGSRYFPVQLRSKSGDVEFGVTIHADNLADAEEYAIEKYGDRCDIVKPNNTS